MLYTKNKEINSKDFKPVLYNLSEINDRNALELLLEQDASIEILDTIDNQVKELLVNRDVQKVSLSEEAWESEVNLFYSIRKKTKETYGVWVYFPWRKMVVHM